MLKSIFTYCYKPSILKRLGINTPVLLCGTMGKTLNVTFNLKMVRQYISENFNPVLMLDTADQFGSPHCGEELKITKQNLSKVKTWCKKLANLSRHIMLDIEPVRPSHIPLYAEIRKWYPYRISGCFGQIINKDILNLVDDTAYMFYDYSTDLKSFKLEISKMLKKIIKTRKPFTIGVPIASSFHEFEELRNKWGKIVLKSPHKMKEYTEAAIEIIGKAKINKNPLFLGIIWWGLCPQPMEKHHLYYYPYQITLNPNNFLKQYGFAGSKSMGE